MGRNISTDRRLVSRLQRSLEPAGPGALAFPLGDGNSDADASMRPVARTSSELISRPSKIAKCHRVRNTTGWRTRVAPARASYSLPMYAFRNCSFYLARLIKRAAPYLSRPSHAYVTVYARPEIRPHRSRAGSQLCWLFGRRADGCVQILWLIMISPVV